MRGRPRRPRCEPFRDCRNPAIVLSAFAVSRSGVVIRVAGQPKLGNDVAPALVGENVVPDVLNNSPPEARVFGEGFLACPVEVWAASGAAVYASARESGKRNRRRWRLISVERQMCLSKASRTINLSFGTASNALTSTASRLSSKWSGKAPPLCHDTSKWGLLHSRCNLRDKAEANLLKLLEV